MISRKMMHIHPQGTLLSVFSKIALHMSWLDHMITTLMSYATLLRLPFCFTVHSLVYILYLLLCWFVLIVCFFYTVQIVCTCIWCLYIFLTRNLDWYQGWLGWFHAVLVGPRQADRENQNNWLKGILDPIYSQAWGQTPPWRISGFPGWQELPPCST